MILIEENGERRLVLSLDGHPDATVLAENVDAPPDGMTADDLNDDGTVSLAVLKQQKRDAVDLCLATAFLSGFTVPSGPLAGKVLQVRSDTDRTNWLASKDIYRDEIDAGQGDTAGADFRTQENETITVTFSEGFSAIQAMGAWGKALMNNSWRLKDAITAATTDTDLDAIDITAGWP